MTHQWHDTYRHQKTPAHHLDPRSKVLVGLLFILAILLSPPFTALQAIGYPALIVTGVLLAGISWSELFKRFFTLLPFVVLMFLSVVFSEMPKLRIIDVLSKAICSIAVMSLLILTTPFPDLLRALERMRLPRLLVLFLGFLYRYGGVLSEEAGQLERAWSARYFGRRRIRQFLNLGHVLAALFIRAYERAERVFAAMQARGFSSGAQEMRVLHFGPDDGVFIGASVILVGLLRWSHWP